MTWMLSFDSKLNFPEHIQSTKVSKANQIVGLIFRTFTYIDRGMFLIRPILEYATTIWSPMYKKDAIQIENVQCRATRLVKGLKELSYPERLKTLGLPLEVFPLWNIGVTKQIWYKCTRFFTVLIRQTKTHRLKWLHIKN